MLEQLIRDGRGELLAHDRFKGVALRDDHGAIHLEDLSTGDVIEVRVGVNDILHRDPKAGGDFLLEPDCRAGHGGIDDERPFRCDQHEAAMDGKPGPGGVPIEVPPHWREGPGLVGTRSSRGIREKRAIGVLSLIDCLGGSARYPTPAKE